MTLDPPSNQKNELKIPLFLVTPEALLPRRRPKCSAVAACSFSSSATRCQLSSCISNSNKAWQKQRDKS